MINYRLIPSYFEIIAQKEAMYLKGLNSTFRSPFFYISISTFIMLNRTVYSCLRIIVT